MRKIHVTQDDHGFWFLSLEEPDGSMKLIAHHYSALEPAMRDAQEFMEDEQAESIQESVEAPRMMLLVDAPRGPAAFAQEGVSEYRPPMPKRAGE